MRSESAEPPRRRQRSKRRQRKPAPSAPAYIKRALPFYAMLDEEALVRLEIPFKKFWRG